MPSFVNLKSKKVIVAVGGGIAAYKVCELVSTLFKSGVEVRIILTKSAQKFITPRIYPDGGIDKWPDGFFDQAEKDLMELL